MLSRLFIQNYAIIEELEIDFSTQLNVITGETGAGKSILVGALGLILGQRAESSVLKNKERKCIVEGCFRREGDDEQVFRFLQQEELDILDEITVRREVAPNGKSRAFINDTPVNLSQLNQLSLLLVDLHQQFDTLELGETDFQREVVDALAGNLGLLAGYGQVFTAALEAKKELDNLRGRKAQFEKEFDYHQFQFNELEECGFIENELESLEQDLKLLTNAEGIKNGLSRAYYELEESDEPVIRRLKGILNGLQGFAGLHPELPALLERLHSSYIELQDIAEEAERINNHIGADAATLEKINDRLSLGYKLLKKHGVKTTRGDRIFPELLVYQVMRIGFACYLRLMGNADHLPGRSQFFHDDADLLCGFAGDPCIYFIENQGRQVH